MPDTTNLRALAHNVGLIIITGLAYAYILLGERFSEIMC